MSKFKRLSNPANQRIIGLTGGIGTGKSTVSDYLSNTHHIPVLDADLYAREAVEPGSPILNKVVERYGPSILLPTGRLDRVRLASLVFNSLAERRWLERQIHPVVREQIETALQTPQIKDQPIVVLSVPLLFEARMTDMVNEIWVVYCPQALQIERLLQRDMNNGDRRYRLTIEQIQARIHSQMAIEKKMQHADIVLDNSSTLECLRDQVDRALGQTQLQALTLS
jgi:dephospho-CoA kinase